MNNFIFANDTIDINRFFRFIKMEIVNNTRFYMIFIGIIAGLELLKGIMTGFYLINSDFEFIIGIVFITGVVVASKAIPAANEKEALTGFLMFPVTAFEKTLGKILVTTIFFFAMSIFSLFAVSFFNSMMSFLLYGKKINIFNPLDFRMLQKFIGYCFVHSIYFLGGTIFHKSRFLKTTISIIGGMIAIGAAISTFSLMFLMDISSSGMNYKFMQNIFSMKDSFCSVMSVAVNILICVISVIFYVISYFRIKRMEVK